MPKSGVRVTLFFQDDIYGFTETHNHNAVSIDAAINDARALMKARLKIGGYPLQARGVRLSMETVLRDSQVLPGSDFVGDNPLPFDYSSPKAGGTAIPNDSDQPKSCLILRAESSDVSRKTIYLAGIPDVLVGENPVGPRNVALTQWQSAFDAWRLLLTGPPSVWGFVGRTVDPTVTKRSRILGVITDPTTGIKGCIILAPVGGIPVYSRMQVTGIGRVDRKQESLNGIWTVSAVDSGPGAGFITIYLRGSDEAVVGDVGDSAAIQLVDYTSYRYRRVQLISQSTRKRGNRSLVGPGRAPTRR